MTIFIFLVCLIVVLIVISIIFLLSRKESFDHSIEEIDEETIRQFFPDAEFEFWINHYVYVYHNNKKYMYKHKNNASLFNSSLCHDCINNYVFFWFSHIHPLIMTIRRNKDYYFMFSNWDGTIPSIPLHSDDSQDYTTVHGIKDIDEFLELRIKETHLIPFYHKKRFIGAFSRQVNEPYVLCILDPFFVETKGFKKQFENDWKNVDLPWEEKINEIIYRGDMNNGSLYNFLVVDTEQEYKRKGHRQYLYSLKKKDNQDFLNFDVPRLTPQEMSKYKYQLELDGNTTSWGSLVWKLRSGSIVFKQESIWEQWYHYKLEPFVHYIPVKNDLSDLKEMHEWCEHHQEECKKIISNARSFAIRELTFEKAIEYMKSSLQPFFDLFDDL
jgi:hypothetical protein